MKPWAALWLILVACGARATPVEEPVNQAVYVTNQDREEAAAALAALPEDRRAAVEAGLEPLRQLEPSLESVQQSRAVLMQGFQTSKDPTNKKNKSPSYLAYKRNAFVILSDLIAATGPVVAAGDRPESDSIELLLAVRELSVMGSTYGPMLIEELAQALPEPLYVHALKNTH